MITEFSCEEGGEFRAAFLFLNGCLAHIKCGCTMTEEELRWSGCLRRMATEYADLFPHYINNCPIK